MAEESYRTASRPRPSRALLPPPNKPVVKDGANAATAHHGESRASVPVLNVDVVEPVGAGDAFAAGFLCGPANTRVRGSF
jgi:2-dehydro-3-deoxygluconokinase